MEQDLNVKKRCIDRKQIYKFEDAQNENKAFWKTSNPKLKINIWI